MAIMLPIKYKMLPMDRDNYSRKGKVIMELHYTDILPFHCAARVRERDQGLCCDVIYVCKVLPLTPTHPGSHTLPNISVILRFCHFHSMGGL